MKKNKYVVFFLLVLSQFFSIYTEISAKEKGQNTDTLLLHSDWRMQEQRDIRAGSTVLFRLERNFSRSSSSPLKSICLIQRSSAQYALDFSLFSIQGNNKGIILIAIAPEELIKLPPGNYEFAVRGEFSDGCKFVSNLLSLSIRDAHATISPAEILNERERFSAFLLLSGEYESYESVSKKLYGDSFATITPFGKILRVFADFSQQKMNFSSALISLDNMMKQSLQDSPEWKIGTEAREEIVLRQEMKTAR